VRQDTAENTTNQDLWLWEARTNTARPLTRSPKNDYAPQFSTSGDTLAFLSVRDSDEGKPSIWMMPLDGGEPWKVASFTESVGEFRWSPDGRTLAFTMLDTLSKQVKEWRKRKWDSTSSRTKIAQYNHLWTLESGDGQADARDLGRVHGLGAALVTGLALARVHLEPDRHRG
jgi:Tol biopolymer transport system component